MPVIQLHDEQLPLKRGQTRLGGGPDADVRLSDDASLGVQAVLDVGADDRVVLRRAGDDSRVQVNGVAMGAEPTPLIHGDKLVVGGVELLFADDQKDGATQYVAAAEIAAMAGRRGGPARATTATGGRLVSLVDGKEYTIADTGIRIGRDASSDVVVAQSEVSRQHCRIAPAEHGYVLADESTNGVFVNGECVQGTRLLARADVIRVGTEEFRFYADVAPVAGLAPEHAAPSAAPAVAVPAPAPLVEPAMPAPLPAPLVEAAARSAPAPLSVEPQTVPTLQQPAAAAPAAPTVDRRPVLAELELLNEGLTKGLRIEIRDALSNIGRGEQNEVVLAHDSVSTAHARLQRRDDGWYLADSGSTNGTFVSGVRLTGERRLEGTPDIRFGGVKVRFHAVAGAVDAVPGMRPISAMAPPRPVPQPPAERAGVPRWVWILLALVVVAGAVYYLKA